MGKWKQKIVGVVSDEGAEIKHVSKFMCIYQDIHSMQFNIIDIEKIVRDERKLKMAEMDKNRGDDKIYLEMICQRINWRSV